MPDEYLADIGPAVKKVAKATGAEQYNILQARTVFSSTPAVHHSLGAEQRQAGLPSAYTS